MSRCNRVVAHRRSRPPGICLATLGLVCGAHAADAAVSHNTGSLGAAASGINADSVSSGPGAVSAGDDSSAVYTGATGSNTIVAFNPALNPPAASPFTVEFWARPTASDNDDAPVSNRVAAGDRSGWVFFQRAAATGWNFRMYSGAGSALGWDLTGGTSNLDEWSHVVATWNGSAAELYVNGALADVSNDPGASGIYNASTAANFIVASSDTGSPFTGSVDEVAFYDRVLTPAQILGHFTTASAGGPGAYHSLARADGALLQLSNNQIPEPSALALLSAAAAGCALRVRRRAPGASCR
jgi:hypothetical protein